MKLYLARHGDSMPMGRDATRPLSTLGKNQITQLAKFLAPAQLFVHNIVHSGKLRAQQTAELLSPAFQTTKPLEISTDLEPDNSIVPLIEYIGLDPQDKLCVGHLPFLGRLVAKLVTGHENSDIVIFKPGTLVCLESMTKTHWVIQWMLSPDLFNN